MAPTEDVIGVLTYAAIEDRHFGTSSPIGNASMPLEWLAAEKSASRLVRQRCKTEALRWLTAYSGDGCDRPFGFLRFTLFEWRRSSPIAKRRKGY
jgi:hypothetical protein